MLTTILNALADDISKHAGDFCTVTSSHHHAAATLSANRPVITLGDPNITLEDEYIGGNIDLTLEVEVWMIHPHGEDESLARAFFSEVFPILAFLGAEKFEPVHAPIQGVNYPAYRTTIPRSHSIGG